MTLSNEDRLVIGTLYRAFNEGDAAMLDDVLSDDWQDTPLAPGQQPGREGLKPLMKALIGAFEGLHFEPEEIVGENGRAAVRLSFSGRHTGEWMGVSATGRRFTIAWHELHHLDAGRIIHTWHVEDWADWRRQVGADASVS